MSKKFNELFRDIVAILRRDYAGAGQMSDAFDPRYYNQAIGQAWHDEKLNELLFLRYVSQMLACTGDRHLRLALRPSGAYSPWGPGFFTRRYENSLYVTAVTVDRRFRVGDRIVAVNGGAPAAHRANIQKNFFFSDQPEREDWNGLLKMADHVTVARPDGSQERLALHRHSPRGPVPAPAFRELEDGILYLRPGLFDGGGETAALLEKNRPALRACRGLILDLRNGGGQDEQSLLPLLPYVCWADTPASTLLESELFVNYTRLNCLLKAAGLQVHPGGEEYIQELTAKAGAGLLPEAVPWEEDIPGLAPEAAVVLTDTWCRDVGELFVQAAKRAGAALIGRPTLGTIDYCGDVRYQLDDRYILTWPTAVTKSALEGRGVLGQGVAPHRYIPWTPEECARDVLLDAALSYIKEGKQI